MAKDKYMESIIMFKDKEIKSLLDYNKSREVILEKINLLTSKPP
jgi:hypothetical protein